MKQCEEKQIESCADCRFTYFHRNNETEVDLYCDILEKRVSFGCCGNAAKEQARVNGFHSACPLPDVKDDTKK